MNTAKYILNSPHFFWIALALPSVGMVDAALGGAKLDLLLHPTGEWAAGLMVAAMLLTPLRRILPKAAWLIWLRRRRRHLGVAAFGYATLHTAYYLIHLGGFTAVAADLAKLGVWCGWVAFLVFMPLALTSNDRSVRCLGRTWRPMQRLTYVAAFAVLAHWIFGPKEYAAAFMYFAPFAILQGYRIWRDAAKALAATAPPSTSPRTTGSIPA